MASMVAVTRFGVARGVRVMDMGMDIKQGWHAAR